MSEAAGSDRSDVCHVHTKVAACMSYGTGYLHVVRCGAASRAHPGVESGVCERHRSDAENMELYDC